MCKHKTLMAIEEVKARRGKVIAFCTQDDEEVQKMLDYYFVIPDTDPELTPLVEMVMAQYDN